MKKTFSMLLTLLLMVTCCMLTKAEVESFTISQIYQEYTDDTRLHVRVESTGTENGRTTQITPEFIEKATIGTGTTPVLSVHAMTSEQSEGMTFLFILDHAMPIGSDRVKELKKGVNSWIDSMDEKDCAAILVAEEEEIRHLTDGFISDKNALHAAVDDYGRANEDASAKNMIFSAIREGILMTANQAWTRPRNCYIVVCSNGADTYQTLVTAEEISSLLSENNLPMYVVGYAYRNTKTSLATLVNLARNSGGWSEDATPSNDQGTIDEAFDRLRMRILSGYDLTLDCSDGFVFNGSTLVSLKFRNQDTPIKRLADLYLLKKEDPTPVPAGQVARNTSQQVSVPQKPASNRSALDSSVIRKATEYFTSGSINSIVSENARYFCIGGLVICILIVVSIIAKIFGKSSSRNKKTKGNEQSNHKSSDRISEIPTDKNLPSDAPSMHTEVVRGESPAVRGPEVKSLTGNQTDRSGEIDRNGTSVTHFKAQTCFVQEMTFRYTIPGQEQKTVVISNPMDISIGRSAGNTLVLDCQKVSGSHAEIRFENNTVWIVNTSRVVDGRRNDLYLDRQRVDEKAVLPNPCHINIGTVSMDVSYKMTDIQTIPTTNMSSQMDDDGRITVRKAPQSTVTERPIALQVTWSLRGKSESKRIPLAHQVTIGRSVSDTVTIPDPETTVSQHHVILERMGNEIIVKNGSKNVEGMGKNPFYHNGISVTEDIVFEDNMELHLGDAKVTISIVRGM